MVDMVDRVDMARLTGAVESGTVKGCVKWSEGEPVADVHEMLRERRKEAREHFDRVVEDVDEAVRAGLARESGRLTPLAHSVIRAVAKGVTIKQVVARYNLTGAAILWLQSQPAYISMFEAFAQQVKSTAEGRKEYAGWIHADVLKEIHLRVVSDPESFKSADLLALAKYLGAISGVGEPKGHSTNIHMTAGVAEAAIADRMDAIRRKNEDREGQRKLEMLKSNGLNTESFAGKEVVNVEVRETE